MPTSTRLHQILERIRSKDFPGLRADFVEQVADVEERNVFDDNRSGALKELRNLLAIEIQSNRVSEDQ